MFCSGIANVKLYQLIGCWEVEKRAYYNLNFSFPGK